MPRVRAPGASDATLVAAVIAGKRIADVAAEHRVSYPVVCRAVLAHEAAIGHRLNRPTQGKNPRPRKVQRETVILSSRPFILSSTINVAVEGANGARTRGASA